MLWIYIVSFLLWFNIFFGLHYEIYECGNYKKGERVKIPLILWIVGIIILIYPYINIIIYFIAMLLFTIYYFLAKYENCNVIINPFHPFLLKRY